MTIIKKLITSSIATLFFFAVLLMSAGRLDYWQAWIYAAMSVLMNISTLFILRDKPDLFRERSQPGAGMKKWDKALLGLGLLLNLMMLLIAGLDAGRYHWSPEFSWAWSLVGLVLNGVGMVIFLLAMNENRFFSAVVRIQTDREQTVCKTGPYSKVRHPGYVGMIIGALGFPFLLMSVWSAIPTLLFVITVVIRTCMEDICLESELIGYREYKQVTRFRLIPGLW